MDPFTLTIRPGTLKAWRGQGRKAGFRLMDVFCTIRFDGQRLSISGVIDPTDFGGCFSAGQIIIGLQDPYANHEFNLAQDWTHEDFQYFLNIWNRWHLNDMRPYDAEMQAAGWPEIASREVEIDGNRKALGWLRPDEHPDGLLGRKLRPDGPGYGTAWFFEAVPEEVLRFLAGLPPADKPYPWGSL
jgi:hypothetical protein